MKWPVYLILLLLVAGSYYFYQGTNADLTRINSRIHELQAAELSGDDISDEQAEQNIQELASLKRQKTDKENERTLKGILLTFLSAGLLGILFVTLVLPSIAHRFTHAVYDSGEMVQRDPMHDAHSLLAQGNYEGAIESLREAAANDPLNRLPWVEIAKIQRTNQEDPDAAIATLRSALESHQWQVNDAAYLLFRLAELYDEDHQDRTTAAAIMHQVISEFPETRHSANARHKLHEWGIA
ncbi:MAG: hypothetical protein RLZZ522_323 [Verrucomicrobiota bacterium]|jgi:tetratricopeptide (TPR) repeat protein